MPAFVACGMAREGRLHWPSAPDAAAFAAAAGDTAVAGCVAFAAAALAALVTAGLVDGWNC